MTDLSKYAKALFLLSEEEGVVQRVKDDLYTVYSALQISPEYAKILDTPALSKDERLSLIEEAFGTLDEYVKNVVKMLSVSHNVYAFSRLYSDFCKLYNEKLGIVDVEAISAVALSEEETARLKRTLETKLSKTVSIRNTVDKSILGGLVLRYDSVQLDGSVKARLEKTRQDLKKIVI